MKKILAILLCLNILCAPVFAEYDFSDEAQAEFDRNKEIKLQPVDFTKKKHRHEVKNEEILNQVLESERTNYEPSPLLYEPVPQKPLLYGSVVKIPAGTSFSITFDSGISSGSLDKNDRLVARLTNDLIHNGQVLIPAGSLVYGYAYDAKYAGYAYGNAEIGLNFNEILTPSGTILKISTENIFMKTQSERAKKMTRDVVIGALGSMLIGAAFTALGGCDNWGRNMAIYGGIGALGGGLRGAMQRGQEIDIPDGTTIQIKLNQPLEVSGI